MKQAVLLYSLVFVCLVATPAASDQSNVKPVTTKKVCPFNIIGMWKSESGTETNPIPFLSFSRNGWVRLLGHSADALPEEFEVIAEVRYRLDKPAAPQRIELIASRGNEVFQSGTTSLAIIEYGDNTFTTANLDSGEQTHWVRAQTHRYFLTFAARGGPAQAAGPAFVMWTTLDGRNTKVDALGVLLTRDSDGKNLPIFGPIPPELYNQLAEESDPDNKREEGKQSNKAEAAIMRLELSGAEFERTHKVFETWDKYVEKRTLPHQDPYLNTMDLVKTAVERLNECDEKLKLDKPNRTGADQPTRDSLRRQPLEYISTMRKKNEKLHLTAGAFPWGWRPMLQPGQ